VLCHQVPRRRSSARDRWQRLRSARELVESGRSYAECVATLQQRYTVSARQAKRYVADARALAEIEPPPRARTPLSVTLDETLLRALRRSARRHQRGVSAEVETILRRHLEPGAS
jgi:hypothetical protein